MMVVVVAGLDVASVLEAAPSPMLRLMLRDGVSQGVVQAVSTVESEVRREEAVLLSSARESVESRRRYDEVEEEEDEERLRELDDELPLLELLALLDFCGAGSSIFLGC